MSQKVYKVEADTELMPFLTAMNPDKSRTTIKSYLAHRQVMINLSVTSQFNAKLKAGDEVTIFFERRTDELRHPMLRIVYEDDAVIVIDKKHGLLSMGTDRERERTAYFILSQHVKRADMKNRIFILHRLDRDTSGLMVFAKNEDVQYKMQSAWDQMVTDRKYTAVVEGEFTPPDGTISTYLTENKGYKVFVTNRAEGDLAVTQYRTLKIKDGYSLLELSLATGKKNQIRAHMEYMKHSIVGDKKYGAKTDPIGRVALHASKLCFIHPVTGETMEFMSPVPGKFTSLL